MDDIRKLEKLEGYQEPYHVIFHDFPVIRTQTTNEYIMIDPKCIPFALVSELWNLKQDIQNHPIFTHTKGFFIKRHTCSKCAKQVYTKELANNSILVFIKIGQSTKFRIEISGPTIRCQNCSHTMFIRDKSVGSALESAIIKIYAENNIKAYA